LVSMSRLSKRRAKALLLYKGTTLTPKNFKVLRPYLKHTVSVTRKLNSPKLHFKKICHTKTVGDRAVLITCLVSAWEKTQGTQISCHVTIIKFTRPIREGTKSHHTHTPGRKLKHRS